MARAKPALQSFIETFVGGRYNVAIEEVTLTTSASRFIDNDFERMAITVINTGSEDCRLLTDNSVAASKGIVLGQGGGSVSMNPQEDLALVGWEWWGVVGTGTTTLTVITVTRYNEGG